MTELENYKFKKSQEVLNKPDIGETGSFILGFDEADPITFLEWVVLNNYFCNDSNKERITWSIGAATENITTEDLYLKFLEYKQTLKH